MKEKNKNLVILSIFIAIIIIQTFVPMLGYIPVGIMNATIIQVTVALGAIILGYKKGMILGFSFGISSLIKNTLMPNPTSFLFSPFVESIGGYRGSYKSLMICLVPRILIGFIAGIVFLYFKNKNSIKKALILSGVLSSLTNTILVIGGIFIFYGKEYISLKSIDSGLDKIIYSIMGLIGTQGFLEAVVSGILCLFIGNILIKVYQK